MTKINSFPASFPDLSPQPKKLEEYDLISFEDILPENINRFLMAIYLEKLNSRELKLGDYYVFKEKENNFGKKILITEKILAILEAKIEEERSENQQDRRNRN